MKAILKLSVVTMIAALYVQKDGAYYGIDGVDPWDEDRDARLYDGPWPVVAHPPCNKWSILAYVVQAKGLGKIGDDGGCFASALAAVRKYARRVFGFLMVAVKNSQNRFSALSEPENSIGVIRRAIRVGIIAVRSMVINPVSTSAPQ